MKHWQIGAAILAVAATVTATVLLLGKKSSSSPPIDGGVRHWVDDNAPKQILSTEITGFYCKFSTYDLPLEDSPIAGYVVILQTDDNGGTYCLRRGSQVCAEGSFSTDEAFFRQLQQLVAHYDFAQYNGQHYTVSGLPPDYGMDLNIRYASGESIRSSNNQSCFLPLEAMEAMVTLFQQQAL